MSIYLHNEPLKLSDFTRELPYEYAGPLLKGGNVLYYAKNECRLIIQEFMSELYTLRLNVFRFLNAITLVSKSGTEGIHTRLIQKGQLRHKIRSVGKVYLGEGEYTMVFASEANCQCIFDRETDYQTLDVFYSPEMLAEYTVAFPALAKLTNRGRPVKLAKHHSRATPAMQAIIHQILSCPFEENTRRFYIDLKVREYLLLLLQDTYHKVPLRYTYTPYERECIVNAEKILMQDLSNKPLSLRELAKAAYISEYKLKEGFREIFGLSVFAYLQKARMEKAQRLLIETDEPLKSICVQTGYARITSFITAFRREFGYTPGSLRRK